jgi:hypothetical protein
MVDTQYDRTSAWKLLRDPGASPEACRDAFGFLLFRCGGREDDVLAEGLAQKIPAVENLSELSFWVEAAWHVMPERDVVRERLASALLASAMRLKGCPEAQDALLACCMALRKYASLLGTGALPALSGLLGEKTPELVLQGALQSIAAVFEPCLPVRHRAPDGLPASVLALVRGRLDARAFGTPLQKSLYVSACMAGILMAPEQSDPFVDAAIAAPSSAVRRLVLGFLQDVHAEWEKDPHLLRRTLLVPALSRLKA